MTKDQKEQYVIQLYKEGKTFKDIARLTHMSFRDIGAIVKRHNEEIERQNGQLEKKDDIKSKSKTTQAFKLFSEGKSPTEVVVELDLEPAEVRTMLRQYLETKNMYEVLQIYEQIKNSDKYSFSSFCRIYQIFVDLRMTEQQISDALRLAKYHQLERLQWKVKCLVSEIWKLDMEMKNKKSILATLDEIIRDSKYKIDEMFEKWVRESYIKKGFRLVRDERIEPGIVERDNLKNSYNSDYNINSGDWKGIS